MKLHQYIRHLNTILITKPGSEALEVIVKVNNKNVTCKVPELTTEDGEQKEINLGEFNVLP